MRKHALKFVSLIAFALVMAFCIPQRAAADQDDPPGRIARLSVAEGSVSFEPAGTDDWVSAVVNRPMTTGDKLWADHDSRAELHLGSASIRLGANTGFSFLNLDDNTVQVQLTEGTLRIRVRQLDRDEVFEVDTPNLAFTASRPGIYRINVNDAGDTTVVVVRQGEGEVTGGGQSYSVHSDETGIFSGTDQLNADIEGVGSEDDFEHWSYERDRREDHSASRRYVSDDAIGYEDLDEYGGWRSTPEYGTIWFPHTTVVGWAPYRYGHWVWISPWGYTWVDDEPWGFAPFHYGRWVTVRGAWGWVPCRPAAVVGVAYVRPVYAPALVAWVGGPNIAVGVAFGGGAAVGWFPLGPREVYVPSYPVSRRYVNNVNITNTTVNTTVVNNYYNTVVVNKTAVNNVTFVNQRVAGAVTATSTQTFTNGRSVHNNVVRVNEREMANARVVTAAPSVAPTRESVVGAGRPAAARPPGPVVTRAVVVKTAPPPPPARFERQQAAIQRNGGRPLEASEVRQIQQEQPKTVVRMAPPARTVTPAPRNAENRPAPPQNVNRPMQQQGNQPNNVPQNNRPATPPSNAERPNNVQPNQPNRPPNAGRPSAPPPNAQPNRPPSNDRPNQRNDQPATQPTNPAERPNTPPPNAPPNRPPSSDRSNQRNDQPSAQPANPKERPNTPPSNAQPNRPPSNDRPTERNDRPSSARPSNNPPPNGNPQLEQQHQQQLETMRKQQDQERQRVEQQQTQERQRGAQQKADEQQKQQMQQQQQRQLQDLEQKHNQEQQRVQQRQQQEHQQQRPPQVERPQPPPRQEQRPPQAERQQPPPRQQQQERPKQQDKPKEKEKDKPPKV